MTLSSNRGALHLVCCGLALCALGLFPGETSACDSTGTKQLFYHNTWCEGGWESDDSLVAYIAAKVWNEKINIFLESDSADATPVVSIRDFIDNHDGYRVLHIASHGLPNGRVRWDTFGGQYYDEAYAELATLESYGFDINPQSLDVDVVLSGSGPYYLELTPHGVQSYTFSLGQFEDDAIVVGWYSYAMQHTTDSWLNIPEVTTMLGKTGSLNEDTEWYRTYFGLACGYTSGGNDGSVEWAVDWANSFGYYSLAWAGDGTNSYDCTRTCVDIPSSGIDADDVTGMPMVRLNGGEASRKGGRAAYLQDVQVLEVPALAERSSRALDVSMSSPGGGRELARHRHMGSHWSEEATTTSASALRVSRSVATPVGSTEPELERPGMARLDMLTAGRVGHSSAQAVSPGRALEIPGKVGTNEPGNTLLIVSAGYATSVNAYANELRKPKYGLDGVNTFFYGPPYDSAWVINRVKSGNEKYVLLIGQVANRNHYPEGTLPLPWILVPGGMSANVGDGEALSVDALEVNELTGVREKAVGVLPIRGPSDIDHYLEKRIQSEWDSIGTEQERRFAFLGYDRDYYRNYWDLHGLVSGLAVRLSGETLIEGLHPCWNVSQYFASTWPDSLGAQVDTTFAYLNRGMNILAMASTKSNKKSPCWAMSYHDDTFYWWLRFSGKFTNLIPMSCKAHEIDFDAENPGDSTRTAIEKLLWVENGGIKTSLGPTRDLPNSMAFEYLAKHAQLLNDHEGRIRIGDLNNAARDLVCGESPSDTVRFYMKTIMLLGDPTLPVYGARTGPFTGVEEAESDVSASDPGIVDASPNPFNPKTKITYVLLEEAHVDLRIYDVRGRRIRKLIARNQGRGTYEESWDGTDDGGRSVDSGVYFIRLIAGESVDSKRVVLVR